MAYDQMFTLKDNLGIELGIIPVALNLDKDIYLLHVFEEDDTLKKKYIRNVFARICRRSDKFISSIPNIALFDLPIALLNSSIFPIIIIGTLYFSLKYFLSQ